MPPLYTHHRLKTSLQPFSYSWYDCKPFSLFLEVMFCGLWRTLSLVLQMPSKQLVCLFKWWHMESDQCCGERPDGTSQVEDLDVWYWKAALAGSLGSANIIWLMPK